MPDDDPCDQQEFVPCVTLNNGVKMPRMNYGVYGASLGWYDYKPKAKKGVMDWLKMGGNGIDTAQLYEDLVEVGEAMRESGISREKIFLETKCSGAMGYYAIVECLQDSLVMLKTDYVDLLLIHFPTVPTPECMLHMPECKKGPSRRPSTPQERRESWDAMELIYKSGKARAIGLSDYSLDLLKETVEHARVPPAVLQVIWNPVLHDDALLRYCQEKGIQLQAWGAVGGLRQMYRNILGDPVISSIAAKHSTTTAEVALAWTLQKGVTIAIGTANPAHMESDAHAFKLTLSRDEMTQIQQINPKGFKISGSVEERAPAAAAHPALVIGVVAAAAVFVARAAVAKVRDVYAKRMGSTLI